MNRKPGFGKPSLLAAILALSPIVAEALNTADLEKLMRTQKIISPAMKVTSSQQGSTIVFAVFPDKDLKESTNTLKIRAVLMAKTIMSADKGVQRVDVQFHQKENSQRFDEVVVRSVDVKAFGAGVTTEEELLSSLQLSTKSGGSDAEDTGKSTTQSTASTTSASSSASSQSQSSDASQSPRGSTELLGAKGEERAKLTARVHSLKAQGVGVKPFLEQLAGLDEMAKSGDSPALSEKLEQLESSIASQEKVLADRKKASIAAAKAAATPIAPANQHSTSAAPSAATSVASAAGSADSNMYMRMFTGMMHHAANSMNVDPRLIPEDGPYYHLRWAMATLIKMHAEKGLGNGVMPMWMECQEVAKTNDEAQVAYKLRNIAQALKLPDPISHQEWYHAQAQAYRQRMKPSRPHGE